MGLREGEDGNGAAGGNAEVGDRCGDEAMKGRAGPAAGAGGAGKSRPEAPRGGSEGPSRAGTPSGSPGTPGCGGDRRFLAGSRRPPSPRGPSLNWKTEKISGERNTVAVIYLYFSTKFDTVFHKTLLKNIIQTRRALSPVVWCGAGPAPAATTRGGRGKVCLSHRAGGRGRHQGEKQGLLLPSCAEVGLG